MFGNTGLMCIWYGERYNGNAPPPVTDVYVTEDESQDYITEDGSQDYVPET